MSAAKRLCVREEVPSFLNGRVGGKVAPNDLSPDVWMTVIAYLPNKTGHHPQWMTSSLTQNSQEGLTLTCQNHQMRICHEVHAKLRDTLTKMQHSDALIYHIHSERFHHTLHCANKDNCFAGHCDLLDNLFTKLWSPLCINQLVREHLTDDINRYHYRYASLDDDTNKWRVIAWFVVQYGVSHLFDASIISKLQTALVEASSLSFDCPMGHYIENDRPAMMNVFFLLVWYIQITNQIKNIHVIAPLLRDQKCIDLGYQSITKSSQFMIVNWVLNNPWRRSLCSVGDPIEDMVALDKLKVGSYQQRNNGTIDVAWAVGIQTQMTMDVCDDDDNEPFTMDVRKFVSFDENDRFLFCKEGCFRFFVVDKQTNVAYNVMCEEVGRYDTQLSHIFFYHSHNIKSYFPTPDYEIEIPFEEEAMLFIEDVEKTEHPIPDHLLSREQLVYQYENDHASSVLLFNRLLDDFTIVYD